MANSDNDIRKREAHLIPVNTFRQVFHWPLSLANPEDSSFQIETVVKSLGANWKKEESRPDCYEEGVYFHDTVQDFLYPGKDDSERFTYRRKNITALTLTIADKPRAFEVEGITLDLFDFGSAVITLEVLCHTPGMLADVQTMIDHGRRAFPGFWKGEDDSALPGLFPSSASLTIDGQTMDWDAPLRSRQRAHWRKTGLPAVFPWWREIAAPLVLAGDHNPTKLPEWRHVLDERIPVMSYISVTDPKLSDQDAYAQISTGDWFRIAGADEAGTDTMPYNTAFLRDQKKRLFYDRFHGDADTSNTTRQCYAGYHFAMVGAGKFFDDYAQGHFRSHYRQMVFIAQMEFATLLTFSRRISDLVREKRSPSDDAAFRDAIHSLRTDLLNFTHRYVFTDVSNHLQAREMNRMLRDSIGLDALRSDVQAELAAASDFANAAEAREATKSQTRLTEFASLFLPATLAAGFGGMNMLAGLDRETGSAAVVAPAIAQLALWVALAYGLGAFLLWVADGSRRVRRWSVGIAAGGAACRHPALGMERMAEQAILASRRRAEHGFGDRGLNWAARYVNLML